MSLTIFCGDEKINIVLVMDDSLICLISVLFLCSDCRTSMLKTSKYGCRHCVEINCSILLVWLDNKLSNGTMVMITPLSRNPHTSRTGVFRHQLNAQEEQERDRNKVDCLLICWWYALWHALASLWATFRAILVRNGSLMHWGEHRCQTIVGTWCWRGELGVYVERWKSATRSFKVGRNNDVLI